MSDFTDEDVTAYQDLCLAGVDPHNMVSHGQEGVAGWIERCSICGLFDLTEHDKRVRAEALREAADDLARSAATDAEERITLWLRARADAEEGK